MNKPAWLLTQAPVSATTIARGLSSPVSTRCCMCRVLWGCRLQWCVWRAARGGRARWGSHQRAGPHLHLHTHTHAHIHTRSSLLDDRSHAWAYRKAKINILIWQGITRAYHVKRAYQGISCQKNDRRALGLCYDMEACMECFSHLLCSFPAPCSVCRLCVRPSVCTYGLAAVE